MAAGELIFVDWQRGQSLREVLLDKPSALNPRSGDRQLDYIARYIEKPEVHAANERCLLVEPHYIDRDFLEDCGAFYIQNLDPPENHCRRLHFFACSVGQLRELIGEARAALRANDAEKHDKLCCDISRTFYLGFTIIRPLAGCPVGRTVLRCHPCEGHGGGFRRLLPVTRQYHAHVGGLDLKVNGLAFQQQDRAVSACATVAIWSAFQRLRETDDIACPSPSQITRLATQYALPFGRSMPAGEGLNVSQMCVAIELLKMAPTITKFSQDTHEACKQAIWSAVQSGYPPILILERLGEIDERLPETTRLRRMQSGFHAATVVGIKESVTNDPPHFDQTTMAGMEMRLYRAANKLEALYVHDDRIGPYRRADIVDRSNVKDVVPFDVDVDYLAASPGLRIRRFSHSPRPVFEYWAIRNLILPVHPRMHSSLSDLDRYSLRLCREIVVPVLTGIIKDAALNEQDRPTAAVTINYWIERHLYQNRAYAEPTLAAEAAELLVNRVGFPRHVGVIRFLIGRPVKGFVDVLLDTTSTAPNEKFLLVVCSGDSIAASTVAGALSKMLGCEWVS